MALIHLHQRADPHRACGKHRIHHLVNRRHHFTAFTFEDGRHGGQLIFQVGMTVEDSKRGGDVMSYAGRAAIIERGETYFGDYPSHWQPPCRVLSAEC